MERELSVNGENFKYFDIGSFQQLGKLHLCITPSTIIRRLIIIRLQVKVNAWCVVETVAVV